MGLTKYTVSFRTGKWGEDIKNVGVIAHNNRGFFAKNVDQNRSADNVTYIEKDLREFYHELFDDALKSYNDKMRSNRKITDYYEHIKKSKQERLFQEVIIGFGSSEVIGVGSEDWEVAKNLCDEYMRTFEKRNPNLKVFNAVMHLDEANPHLHIDFVPVAHKSKNGMPLKNSMTRALIEQGFSSSSKKSNEWHAWEDSEREFMTEILHRHNLERDYKNEHRPHLQLAAYKAQQAELEKMKAQTERIKANVAGALQKNPAEVSAEEAAMLQNENALMKKQIEKQREQFSALAQRYNSPIVKFEIYNSDKLLYVARELENSNVQFAEEENALYVPEFALEQCKKFAADFKNIFPGIKEKIKMDIDVLVLSSESLEQLLDKLNALGYEIKHGKYLAVKSPEAQKFTRLKSLGEEYLPENLEKRMLRRNVFPNAVRTQLENASGIEREFHLEVSRTIIAIQGLAFRPKKSRADEIYDFENDDIINRLSKQIITLAEFDINSREKLYKTAEELQNKISEKSDLINKLKDELPALKKKVESGNASEDQRRRCELLPDYVSSLQSEIQNDRLKLSRLAEVIEHLERISGGDYLGNFIREQKEREAQAREKIQRGKSAEEQERQRNTDRTKM